MSKNVMTKALIYPGQESDLAELACAVGKIMDKLLLPLVFDETLQTEKEWRADWAPEIEETKAIVKNTVDAKLESCLREYVYMFERWKQTEKEVDTIEAAAVAKTLAVPEVRQMLFAPDQAEA